MRFFKHGESLAIVLPDKLRKSSSVKDSDEYEFFELSGGLFVLMERRQLEEMVKKNVFAELMSRLQNEPATPSTPAKPPSEPSSEAVARPSSPASSEDLLSSQGFAVIANEAEARLLSKSLEQQIKGKQVFGVRGFDKKFYIVSESYLRPLADRILKALPRKEMALRDLALQLKADEAGCLAVLQVLKEQGEVIEKRRGVFKAIS